MVRLVYDFNTLGRMLLTRAGVNGISRVIEELANALYWRATTNEDLTIEFSSVFYPQAYSLIKKRYAYFESKFSMIEPSAVEKFVYQAALISRAPFRKGKQLGNLMAPYRKKHFGADIVYSPFYGFNGREFFSGDFKQVATIHDIISMTRPEFFNSTDVESMRVQFESLVRYNDFFFAVSEHTKYEFCEYFGVSEDRVWVTSLAAASRFSTAEEYSRETLRNKYSIGSQPFILSVATLEPRKNLIGLINAYSRLIEMGELSQVKLVLAGALGWKYEPIFDLIQKNTHLRENIIITGFVDESDLPSLYREASCFVYLSFCEGFGLPVLEAMQCGAPVLASDIPSIKEIVGDAAILVDPYDLDAVCEGLISILNNQRLAREYSIKAMKRSAGFSWERAAGRMVEAFREIT